MVQIASALQWAEDFPASLQHAHDAIALAEAVNAPGPLSGGLFVRGYVRAVSGRTDDAEFDLQRALDIARLAGDAGRQALALNLLGHRRSWRGEYQASLELNAEGARIAREHRLAVPLLRCLWVRGITSTELGAYDQALEALSEGLALAEKMGDDAFVPRFLNTLGWLRIDGGDLEAGLALSERAYTETNRSSRAGHGTGAERRAFIRNNEADALLAQGDLAGATAALEEAYATVQAPPPSRWMTWRYAAHCYATLGELALRRGDPERARRMADHCLEHAVPTASRKYETWAWRLKGESARRRHAWDEATDALGRALAMAGALGQPRQIWLGQLAQGRLHADRGRRDDALASYRAARNTIITLRERTGDPGLRAALSSAPLVREVEDLASR
jgi:tetratricopeptide (TPR) repeat protein